MTRDNVFSKNWSLLGEKRVSTHAHQMGSWYLLGVLFKISDEHPRSDVVAPLAATSLKTSKQKN